MDTQFFPIKADRTCFIETKARHILYLKNHNFEDSFFFMKLYFFSPFY